MENKRLEQQIEEDILSTLENKESIVKYCVPKIMGVYEAIGYKKVAELEYLLMDLMKQIREVDAWWIDDPGKGGLDLSKIPDCYDTP